MNMICSKGSSVITHFTQITLFRNHGYDASHMINQCARRKGVYIYPELDNHKVHLSLLLLRYSILLNSLFTLTMT